MASQTFTSVEVAPQTTGRTEGELLQRLLGLYEEEQQIYRRVLELSHRQGEIVRNGGSLAEVRRVLEQKKNCLEIIGRLEVMEKRNKQDWERRRLDFSRAGRNRLQDALNQVTRLIEEILTCEEQNDLYLIEQARSI
jgi:hypothetical protein